MATASRRFSRKQLRQPDWFQVTTEKALQQFNQHRFKILIALAALLLLIMIVVGWQIFKAQQNTAASKEFGTGLDLYQSQKYREAIPAFQKVQSYRWSRYAALAHLYEASSYLSLNEVDNASAPAQRFLLSTGPETLYRQIALMTVANIEERQKQCERALARYGEAERINGPFQQQARLGKARCAEATGDISGAISSYRDYLKQGPDSLVTLRLAELEAKNSGQQPAK